MSTINKFFVQKNLANGFVLLYFTDFKSCINFFKQSNLMQEWVFFDIASISSSVPDFPGDTVILAPSNPGGLDSWDCASTTKGSMFRVSYSEDEDDLQNLHHVQGKKFGFLFTPLGAEVLHLR